MSMELLKKHRFVGIFRHIPPQYALRAAKAMYEGGIRIFEITFDPSGNTTAEQTCSIIRQLRENFGKDVSVGAGTVLSVAVAEAAWKAGAEFIVAPCTKEAVIRFTKEKGMLSIPGAYTPTEIMNAYELGADVVKIFPILPNDEAYLKNVISPLSHIPFMITGGINPDTIEKFLATGPVAVAAGASIVTKELVEKGDFETIRKNALAHTGKIKRRIR